MTRDPVLILGARSDIALAAAHAFAARGHPLQLAARNSGTLETACADIALRYGVNVTLHDFDALDTANHERFVDALMPLPEIVVCAVGLLGDQAQSESDSQAAINVMRSNFEGPAHGLAVLANRFAARGSGTIVGIGSVAGERGRASNYVYGAAKAGFNAFLSGLRNRLVRHNVHVVTVLPGFVATRMTEGMDLPPALTATPEAVAKAIVRAVEARRNVVYVKPVWRLIMLIIKAIPEFIFKKLKI